MSDYRPAKRRIDVSVGESVRIIRELQGTSQNDMANMQRRKSLQRTAAGRSR